MLITAANGTWHRRDGGMCVCACNWISEFMVVERFEGDLWKRAH